MRRSGIRWHRSFGRLEHSQAHQNVTVKRAPLPRRGDAVCVLGCPQKCIEALAKVQQVKETNARSQRQRSIEPGSFFEKDIISNNKFSSSFAVVIASCDSALRSILEARSLRSSNIVGCVEPLAFNSGQSSRTGSALVLSVECGDGVEAFTFDSRVGALPDLGQPRFTEALEPGMSPHFLVLAGAKPQEENEFDNVKGTSDAAVLTAFRRRVDGLFPGSSCHGVVVRGDDRRPGRLVHARRRKTNNTHTHTNYNQMHPSTSSQQQQHQHTERAGRLKVYRAHGGAVGVALLPRSKRVSVEDMNDCARRLSRLAFGGDLALKSSRRKVAETQMTGFKNPLSRLWAAGDGTMGNEQHRVHAAFMTFLKAFDEADAEAMSTIWLDEREAGSGSSQGIYSPTLAHNGSKLIRGYEYIQRAWRRVFTADCPSLQNNFSFFLRRDIDDLTDSRPDGVSSTATPVESDPLDSPNYGIHVEDLHIDVAHDLAYATCILNVTNDGPNQATTIFAKDSSNGRWAVVHFHCSSVMEEDDEDEHIINFDEDDDDSQEHHHDAADGDSPPTPRPWR